MRTLIVFLIITLAAFAQPEPKTAKEFYARAQNSIVSKQWDRVVEDSTLALEKAPNSLDALLLRASAYATLKQHVKAVADFDAALRIHPEPWVLISRGVQLMLLKQNEAAIADFTETIRRNPKGPAAYELRANIRRKLGDILGASEDYATAAELSARPAPGSLAQATAWKIGGPVKPPRLKRQVEPQYVEEARAARWQGTVLISLVVDAEGIPRQVSIVSPIGYGLDEKAIEAILQWRFEPGTRNGEPVDTQATIEVSFRLL